MRGKVTAKKLNNTAIRITPAYAGKRVDFFHSVNPEQDHPRLCGEKCRPMQPHKTNLGSPPPMRGKVAASPQAVR